VSKPRCSECHDTKPLNDLGVCAWRHGCEHRQMVAQARLLREVEEIIEDAAEWRPSLNPQQFDRPSHRLLDYWRHPASRDDTNVWIDRFLWGESCDNEDPDDGYSAW
jgi:hypothetical protein